MTGVLTGRVALGRKTEGRQPREEEAETATTAATSQQVAGTTRNGKRHRRTPSKRCQKEHSPTNALRLDF